MKENVTRILTTIASWCNGESEDDEEYISESLMVTWDGKYYLYCEGGEMTYFSQFPDGVLVNGLSKLEAQAWCNDHGIETDVINLEGEVA